MEFRVIEADWSTRRVELMAVRNAVFVDEQGVPADLEADGRDADAMHFLATDAGGHAVGTARLLADGQIGRIAVLPAFRRCGIGSRLLAAAMDAARTRGHRRVWLHAQIDAQTLYLQAGFRIVGERFLEAGIPHSPMQCDLT